MVAQSWGGSAVGILDVAILILDTGARERVGSVPQFGVSTYNYGEIYAVLLLELTPWMN
jgi:hypothetical protein